MPNYIENIEEDSNKFKEVYRNLLSKQSIENNNLTVFVNFLNEYYTIGDEVNRKLYNKNEYGNENLDKARDSFEEMFTIYNIREFGDLCRNSPINYDELSKLKLPVSLSEYISLNSRLTLMKNYLEID